MSVLSELKRKLNAIWPHLDERTRRLTAANEAISLGYGGVSLVSRACGLSRVAIHKGMREIREGAASAPGQVRRPGAGRKPITNVDPEIVDALDEMIEGDNLGDPESPLRWVCKSTREISAALSTLGHSVSHTKVAQLLHAQGYRLHASFKTKDGAHDNSDRDAQFRHISAEVTKFLMQGLPVLSVHIKQERLGDYRNHPEVGLPVGRRKPSRGHAFAARQTSRAFLYGIYDIGRNTGFVNVRADQDTGEFAVASIHGWWRAEGLHLYPNAKRLLITADSGGGVGYRPRLWLFELQRLADETALEISICHFPRGTSKWNKIERRLFSFISSNWRGEPLRDYETIVSLITNDTTAKGLKVSCRLDRRRYSKVRKDRDVQMKQIKMKRDTFQGEWNYIILPRLA